MQRFLTAPDDTRPRLPFKRKSLASSRAGRVSPRQMFVNSLSRAARLACSHKQFKEFEQSVLVKILVKIGLCNYFKLGQLISDTRIYIYDLKM